MQINIQICITIFSPFPTNQRNACSCLSSEMTFESATLKGSSMGPWPWHFSLWQRPWHKLLILQHYFQKITKSPNLVKAALLDFMVIWGFIPLQRGAISSFHTIWENEQPSFHQIFVHMRLASSNGVKKWFSYCSSRQTFIIYHDYKTNSWIGRNQDIPEKF